MAPTTVYERLRAVYSGVKEPQRPAITPRGAVALLVAYAGLYVGSLYLSKTTRPSATLSRDSPSVIRGRVWAASSVCVICSVATWIIRAAWARDDGPSLAPLESLHQLGYYPAGVVESLKALLLTAILFLGPLFEAGIAEGGWRAWLGFRGLAGWTEYRTYVAGPITEEVLFRSASVPLLLLARASNNTIIFLTPLIFGLAHFHHLYEFRITHPDVPLVPAILRTLLQLTYTTLFGGYATFLYLRTGSLLSVILVHSFCNWMGLPRFWGRVTAGDSLANSELGTRKRSEDRDPAPDDRLGILWSFVYYILLVAGAVSWWHYLWPLTASDLALANF